MVSNDKSICQNCGSKLKRYDKVSRIVRTKGGKTSWIEIERFRCPVCGQIHRELPDYIFPYKQYEAEVIRGVLEGFITCETYGYEDYPCEMTMIRWRNSQELQGGKVRLCCGSIYYKAVFQQAECRYNRFR